MKRKILILALIGVGTAITAFGKPEWNEYKKQHFIVYYKEAPFDFVKTVEESAERYYKEISREMGFIRHKSWNWDERAKIYIYDDSQDYVTAGRHARWSHGVASPSDKVIRTFPTAHGFFDSTLPHEIGHIIFREFIGYNSRVPPWLEEGVAMYQEKARRFGANRAVKQAMENEMFIPLSKLTLTRLHTKSDPELVNLVYAESASVVYFLITEYGKHRFVRFCRKLESGMKFEDALAAVYVRFKNIDRLNKSWTEYIEDE